MALTNISSHRYEQTIPDHIFSDDIKAHLDAIIVAGKMIDEHFYFTSEYYYPKIQDGVIYEMKMSLDLGDNKFIELSCEAPAIILTMASSSGKIYYYVVSLDERDRVSYPVKQFSLKESSSGGYHQIHHTITKKENFLKTLDSFLHTI